MEMLPKPELVTQISERRAEVHVELAAVRADMQTGFAHADTKLASLDSKFAGIDTRFAELMAKSEHDMCMQLIWLIATIIAMSGVIIGVLH